MFDVEQFKKRLNTTWLGHDVIYVEQLESTNSYLRSLNSDKISHGTLCITDHQTRGRGQYERNWISEPGANLTFTLVVKPKMAERLHVLTLACALAATEQVETLVNVPSYIKWPNDVYSDGKKLGGLLTETVFSGNNLDRVLIGIGLNINQKSFKAPLNKTATSFMQLSKGASFERELVLAHLLQKIEYNYDRWNRLKIDLLKSINQRMLGYGQWVKLIVNDEPWDDKCKFLGINEKGQLVVLTARDEIETFSYEQIRIITD